MSSLAAALLEFQKEAPRLGKDATATVQTKSGGSFSYSYVSLDSIMDKVLPVLNKHGIVVQQFPTIAETGAPALRTRLVHAESGDFQEDTMLLLLASPDPQSQGSALTYARRYSLMAALGLVADDDDDASRTKQAGTTARDQHSAPPAPPDAELASRAQHAKLNATLKDLADTYPTTDQESWLSALKNWSQERGYPATRKAWTKQQMTAAIDQVNGWVESERIPF